MKPTHIIVHCSATKDSGTVSWSAIRKYHTGDLGWSDIGYHFGLELVGDNFEILTGRPLNRMGSHCKARGMNHNSLGFCFIGDYDQYPPPPEMWDKGARYIAGLCIVLGIPVENVEGHREYESHKTCPGTAFDMVAFRWLVADYINRG